MILRSKAAISSVPAPRDWNRSCTASIQMLPASSDGRKSTPPIATSRSFGRQPTTSATSPAYEASSASATARMCSGPPDQSRSLRSAGSRSRKRSLNSMSPPLCQVTVGSMPRYIILGAGAVGAAVGGRLGLAGQEVVLVARGDHLATLRERGLRLRTPDEDVTQRLTAIGGP